MKKALVIIDFQNDFVDGALGFKDAKEIEDIIVSLIEEYKKNNNDLIFTKDTHDNNYLNSIEGKHLPVIHCIKGTEGHEIFGKVKKYETEGITIEKNGFGSIELGNLIKEKGYDEVEFCGLVSNICVLSNIVIVKTIANNVEIKVPLNGVKSFSKAVNSTFKEYLEALGVNVYERN